MSLPLRTRTALLLAGLMLAGASQAQSPEPETAPDPAPTPMAAMPADGAPPETPLPAFADLDKDGNGAIAGDEATALPALARDFASVDSNGDGAISEAEYATYALKSSEENARR